MENLTNQRIIRFGNFEADRQTGELRKQGQRLALQGQPFEVLLMLLERPGELVARGEFRERLWPDGTFVDFDHSLNTAVNKIRDVLGDSAGSPRFIETLARRGYRFVAPVTVVGKSEVRGQRAEVDATNSALVAPQEKAPPSAQNAAGWGTPRPEVIDEKSLRFENRETWSTRKVLTSVAELPEAPHSVVRLLFFLLQAMYFCFYVIALARLHGVEDIVGSTMMHPMWVVVGIIVTAVVGIPTRLYIMTAVAFRAPGLREKFLRLFAVILLLDALWALAPFLLLPWIGYGLALGATAILLYVPFAERSLILMGAGRAA